jgi:hypothetical protein
VWRDHERAACQRGTPDVMRLTACVACRERKPAISGRRACGADVASLGRS